MEYLIGIILALLGGLFYYKRESEKNAVKAKTAETRGRDLELREQQKLVENAIAEIDANLKKIEETRQKKDKYKTLKERADAAKNRYKK